MGGWGRLLPFVQGRDEGEEEDGEDGLGACKVFQVDPSLF